MCLQLNNSIWGNCKCKFADSCKRHVEFERGHIHPRWVVETGHALSPSPAVMNTATTIDFIPNKIYPPSNFVDCWMI
jgi:hypothetical protein